jgi:2-C-methyl-D-erythritol 4-phosphate cytidylyltransferase
VPPHESVWTIVVGGGSGTRFGRPKQYEALGERRVIDRAVATARQASDGVVVVVPPADAAREGAIAGGSTRSESVRAGLAAVPDEASIICVHDAARPFASLQLFELVVAAVRNGADGAVPGVPVTDTIKMVGNMVDTAADAEDSGDADGKVPYRPVLQTPDREALVAVQTPQAFRASVLRRAHTDTGDGTDDASLVERIGGTVVVVTGETSNRKITLPDDLEWARRFEEIST